MYMCAHTLVDTYIHTCGHTHIHLHTHNTGTHTHTHVHTEDTHIHIETRSHTHIHKCTHTHMHAHTNNSGASHAGHSFSSVCTVFPRDPLFSTFYYFPQTLPTSRKSPQKSKARPCSVLDFAFVSLCCFCAQ